uniref:Eukaryotic translation initiation factor 3 subunit p66 n=1 Tax=Heterorhabditis bacteriophora TaxID=37862 RepID=A0A1I7WZS4_HETBA
MYSCLHAFQDRLPSVQVRPEWRVIEEMDFPRLLKRNLPSIGPGQDIENHQYGTLHYYDKAVDRVLVKNPITLQRCGGSFYSVSTTEDPVIEEIAQKGIGNVYATDIILATLMTAPRSVYSWDIVAHRVGDKLFLDKRDTGGISNPVDALTVSETSGDTPAFEGAGINNAKDLATEALFINQNFRRQVLRRTEEGFKMVNERAPFEEEGGESGCAYKFVFIFNTAFYFGRTLCDAFGISIFMVNNRLSLSCIIIVLNFQLYFITIFSLLVFISLFKMEQRVKHLEGERWDYKAWSYQPVSATWVDYGRWHALRLRDQYEQHGHYAQ